MAFLKTDFHPCTVHPFMIQLVEHVVVKKNPAIFPNLLLAHLELGASVDGIMIFQHGDPGICKITWVNQLYKPAGIPAPPSCPKCCCVFPWDLNPPAHHDDHQPQRIKGCHPGKFIHYYIDFFFNELFF